MLSQQQYLVRAEVKPESISSSLHDFDLGISTSQAKPTQLADIWFEYDNDITV